MAYLDDTFVTKYLSTILIFILFLFLLATLSAFTIPLFNFLDEDAKIIPYIKEYHSHISQILTDKPIPTQVARFLLHILPGFLIILCVNTRKSVLTITGKIVILLISLIILFSALSIFLITPDDQEYARDISGGVFLVNKFYNTAQQTLEISILYLTVIFGIKTYSKENKDDKKNT